MSSSAKFKARIIVEDGDTQEVEVWDDELSPFSEDGRRPIRDWAREHLSNYGNEGLRELLELPAEGNYEVVIEADINGYHSSSPNGDDYDEDLTINSIKQQKIPEGYYDLDPLTPLIIDDLMDADKVDDEEDVSDEQARYCEHVQELDRRIDSLQNERTDLITLNELQRNDLYKLRQQINVYVDYALAASELLKCDFASRLNHIEELRTLHDKMVLASNSELVDSVIEESERGESNPGKQGVDVQSPPERLGGE